MTVFKELVCLFVLSCGPCLLTYAQETVSVSLQDRPLSEFISQIEQKTDCSFIFSKDMVDMSLMVTVEAESRPLSEVLDTVLIPLGIRWQMEERHIILTPLRSGQVTVTGKVTVAGSNEPVIGAAVHVEGMESVGAITDIDGSYVIRTMSSDPVLVFSYMGFRDVRVPVAGRDRIDVVMEEDAQLLEELVVVAYGVQKKANMSGSVSSVDFSAAGENRILTNVSSGLQGLSAGLLAQQSSGEPGADGASILIRGVGTLNNTSPLVVIDGIVGEIDDVNPQDIASMSILKDAASSAIYGSRAANGVILITTKTGSKEKIQIRYNVHGGIQSVSSPIDVVSDYPTYMEAINTAMKNSGNVPPYSEATIAEWRQNSATDPTVYPNTDWFRYMFKPAYIMEHNLQASGGTDRINFICSLGYLSNEGMMPKTYYDRYSFRLGISAVLTRWLRLNANINGYHGVQGGVDVSTVMTTIGNSSPGTLPVHPDGRFGGEWAPGSNVSAGNALQEISSYDRTTRNTRLNGKVGLDIDITKHLKWMNTLAVSVNFNSLSQMNYANIEKWDFKHDVVLTTTGAVQTQLTESYARKHNIILDSWLQYDDFIAGNENHTLSAMLGYNQEYNQYHDSYINALDVLSNDTPVLNAATTPSKITGTFTDSAVRSFFGRINYDWRGRYIFEANLRADGSSRFAKGKRWGVFPSFSAAWRISEEPFMKGARWIDNLKIRASWGQLGNNSIDDYATQLLYQRRQYVFGETAVTGAGISAVVNSDLTWETTSMTNVGIDLVAFDNRFSVTADVFDKLTDDILMRAVIPGVLGDLEAPYTNAGIVRNRGMELELSWRDNIGDFYYAVSANYSYVKNKVLKYQGTVPTYSGQTIILEGYGIRQFYVREVECIATQERIDRMLADGYQFYPSTPKPGDFIYRDQQKPGEMGYKIINDDDRVIKGNSSPTSYFGLNLSCGWKGIDFSMLWSGVAGVSCYLNSTWYTNVLKNGSMINAKFLDAWSYDNQDSGIPALTADDGGRNTVANDFWLQDASYIKLRNVSLGYTFPEKRTRRISVPALRIYVSGENLLTLTRFDGMDPENGSSTRYPNMKRFNIGLSITFN